MPRYKKKNYRPGYISCGKMVLTDAQRALKVAMSVKRLLNVEVKNHDVQQTSLVYTDTVTIFQLTNIPRGDTTNTRDGAQCKVVALELSFIITKNVNATVTHTRLMIVQDKQTNQAIYTSADLLEDVTASDVFISPANLDNRRRFNVLYDRKFVMDSVGVESYIVKKYFKMNMLLRFDAAAADITDLTQNSLSLLLVGSEVTNDPVITFFARVRFIDN